MVRNISSFPLHLLFLKISFSCLVLLCLILLRVVYYRVFYCVFGFTWLDGLFHCENQIRQILSLKLR